MSCSFDGVSIGSHPISFYLVLLFSASLFLFLFYFWDHCRFMKKGASMSLVCKITWVYAMVGSWLAMSEGSKLGALDTCVIQCCNWWQICWPFASHATTTCVIIFWFLSFTLFS